jgi:hypothetical protein
MKLLLMQFSPPSRQSTDLEMNNNYYIKRFYIVKLQEKYIYIINHSKFVISTIVTTKSTGLLDVRCCYPYTSKKLPRDILPPTSGWQQL